jgi:hypothetical protein
LIGILPFLSDSHAAAMLPIIAAIGKDPVNFKVKAEYAIRASPAPTGSTGFSVNESSEIILVSALLLESPKPIIPRAPSFKIRFLHCVMSNSLPASCPIIES